MIDIEKQIAYWRDSSNEDWEVAGELVNLGRTRHGLFFAHLSLEKMLKAHVCRTTNDLAPKLHSLPRLAELSQLSLSTAQQSFLFGFDRYQLEGRYPDQMPHPPEINQAKRLIKDAEEILRWLIQQL